MFSDNDNKNLDLIKNLINQCLKRINDSYFIQSTFSSLIQNYSKLDDNTLKFNIEKKTKEILIERNPVKIKQYLEELLFIISKIKEKNKTYLDVDLKNVDRSDRYKVDCERYSDKNIQSIEKRILESPFYQKKLHEFLKEGNWRGRYHARLDDNLRIIYNWDKDNKKIKFEAIVTHDEL